MDFPKIEARAEELLKSHKLLSPPIDVFSLANQIGISIDRGRMGDNVSGAIHFEGEDRAAVGLNITESQQRQRFTLAHEIGHFLMHRDRDLYIDSHDMLFRKFEGPANTKERDANVFAAALLMPKPLLEAERKVSSQDDVARMAKKYKVSVPAMSYRLLNLGLVDLLF